MKQIPRVTVVIRTKNEATHIGDVLNKVREQRDVDFDIVVVDSGSTDQTLDFVAQHPVKLVKIPADEFTYGRALNRGISEATGEFVAFLSAHAMPLDRNWLANLVAPFSDPEVVGVVGKSLPHPDCNPFDRRGLLRRFSTERQYLHHDSSVTFSNANSAARKSALDQFAFDEALPYSEDLHWSRHWMKQGKRIVYEPTATVYHSHNETPPQLFARFYNESRARAEMGYDEGRFSKMRLLYDLFAGTAYDGYTAVVGEKSLRWLLFAPRRRFAINMGRYFGSRRMDRDLSKMPLTALLIRFALVWTLQIFGMMERLAPVCMGKTNKLIGEVHPREIWDENLEQRWYDEALQKKHNVLVLGCRQGVHFLRIAERNQRVYGVDDDRQSLYIANFQARWAEVENLQLLYGQPDELPFADGSFDVVIAFGREETLPVDEIDRVTEDGALLLFSAANRYTRWKRFLRRYGFLEAAGTEENRRDTRLEEQLATANWSRQDALPSYFDSPWTPLMDLLGGISLGLYDRFMRHRAKIAQRRPSDAESLRLVYRKGNV